MRRAARSFLLASALLAACVASVASSAVARADNAGSAAAAQSPKSTNGKPVAGKPAAAKPAHPVATKGKKPTLPPHYLESMHGWHAAPPGEGAPKDETGRTELVLSSINGGEKVVLPAARADGGFRASDLERAAHVLREPGSGNEHPVDPRLLDILYRLELHFNVAEVRILSGYRTPRRQGASNHGRGRATDIVVPGVKDEEVAKYARQIGFTGVGIYPTSGFVHVDVRPRSYFWSDASGPGRKNRERGILGDLAKSSDAQAIARGEHATDPFDVSFDVDGALKSALAAQAAHAATNGANTPNAAGEGGMSDDDDDSDDSSSGAGGSDMTPSGG